MALHGNSGTISVATGSFTTPLTGFGATTVANRGFLVNVSIVANAASTPPFSVVTYLQVNDGGVQGVFRIHELCGDVSGDPSYDQGTDVLDWTGRIPLGKTRNQLLFGINNDSGSTIVALWGWVSSDD